MIDAYSDSSHIIHNLAFSSPLSFLQAWVAIEKTKVLGSLALIQDQGTQHLGPLD